MQLLEDADIPDPGAGRYVCLYCQINYILDDHIIVHR